MQKHHLLVTWLNSIQSEFFRSNEENSLSLWNLFVDKLDSKRVNPGYL